MNKAVDNNMDFIHKLKILSNPTRVNIFSLLMSGSHCHCEVAEKLNISLSLLSHHLNVLINSGLVTAQRNDVDARWVHYNIDTQVLSDFRAHFLRFTDPNQIQARESICAPNQKQVVMLS